MKTQVNSGLKGLINKQNIISLLGTRRGMRRQTRQLRDCPHTNATTYSTYDLRDDRRDAKRLQIVFEKPTRRSARDVARAYVVVCLTLCSQSCNSTRLRLVLLQIRLLPYSFQCRQRCIIIYYSWSQMPQF